MKILVVVMLMAIVAQVPSCSSEEQEIVGFVDDKYIGNPFGGQVGRPLIIIGATEYMVSWDFYREVRIGDLVKWSNGRWIIVKKAGA